MKLLILHLSDIHVHENNNPVLERYEKIGATLLSVMPDVGAVFIVVTGDIAFSGSKLEYEHATVFLQNLIKYIESKISIPVHVILVPGNHDGEFKKSSNTRNATIEKIQEKGESFIDDEVIEHCTSLQKNYFEFEKQFATPSISDPLWKEYDYKFDDYNIAFSAINASWMSKVPEEQGKLVFPLKRYSSLHNRDATIRIVLLHHPLNWYSQGTYHPLRDLCRSSFQIIMTGHEHINSTNITIDDSGHESINLEAGALSPHNSKDSVFSVLTLDLGKKRFAHEKFFWDGDIYQPSNGSAVWDSFLALPEPRSSGFQINEITINKIESLGATFAHPNLVDLKLSDIFVYPDLLDIDSEDDQSENVSSDILSKQLESLGNVIIFGDDHYGKSSLLNHLYLQFHRVGYVPILLNPNELKSATEDQFSRIVKRTFTQQYDEDSLIKYTQLDKKKKIAFVDNIDKLGTRGDVLVRVLDYLSKHFGYLILTAGDRFDVTVLSSPEASNALKPFKSFRMLGFGYRLRNELIRRWHSVGSALLNEELQEKVHNAEQIISGILGKGLVPMTAFNVLVLLQTIEVNQKNALANSGLAEYYEFLIRRSLYDAKVQSDELDEHLSYLSHLAWEMYQLDTRVISEDQIAKFNQIFSAEIHKTKLIERLETLEKAKILLKNDEGYYFTYPYLEYFFVAMFMSNNLEEIPDLKEKIIHFCHHLYIKKNANIVLFLTHHSNSKWIIQEIASLLSELLSDIKPLELETDTKLINTWVGQKARIAVDTRDHITNQKRVRKNDDNLAKKDEPEQKTELTSIQELDRLSQLNLLFKTSEILGQILKGRYGSLGNKVKAELLKQLFDAPLRGVNYFLSLVNEVPDALLVEISDRIRAKVPNLDKEKSDRAAKRYIFSVIGSVADSFLSRQGEIIGSPKLKNSIEDLANSDGGLSYRLVSVAAQLSYPNHAPIDEIKRLSAELDQNYFGYKTLQGLVARHMYMYYLPQNDRHSLASTVGIDEKGNRSIEFKSHGSKKVANPNSKITHSKSLIAKLKDSFIANNQTIKERLSKYEKKIKDVKDKK
ncbi:putative phosphohydrolase [Methylophilaceae bacterium 11]|nr:putative phosphohydrolase [Methylophilaceae bacterium 11]